MENRFFGILFGILFVAFWAGCSGGGGGSYGITGPSTPATLVSIEVSPGNPSIAMGTAMQLKATGIYSDSTKKDLTSSVTWSSSTADVASVSNASGSNGLATSGTTTGSSIIKATSGTVFGSTTLTVTSAALVSVEVTPTNPGIALGRSQQCTATGIFTDNTVQDLTKQAAWSSSDPAIATIGASDGLASSVGVGSATITATFGGKSGSTVLTVTNAVLQEIDITPAIPTIALGTSQQFTATGTYSDSSTADLTATASWSSDNTAVATVSSGLAHSVRTGSATITATLDGVSGSTVLTVDSAALLSIDVTPTNPSTPLGVSQQFSASGNFSDGTSQDLTTLATWSSSNNGIADVSNTEDSNGLATPFAAGQTTITAMFGGIAGSSTLTVTSAQLASIQITPAAPQIALGTALQFTAIGTYTDNTSHDITTLVVWNSSDGSVAAISNAGNTKGLATSVGVGTTSITAALGTVTTNVPVILTVTQANLTSITITPGNATIFLGAPEQFTATGNFTDVSNPSNQFTQDLTSQVTWRSSNKTIATISNAFGFKGLVTPIRAGSTTISATFAGFTQSTGLTVSSAKLTGIVITPANASVAVGKILQFKATGYYEGGLTQDLTNSVNLTWASSNKSVATVVNVPKKNKGLATGVSRGSVTIKASLRRGGGSGTTTLTVI